jgi:hypothetical protein
MPHRKTYAKKRSHKRRSTLRNRRHRGGSDCPPRWTHTEAQEAAFIIQQTKDGDFCGRVEFNDRVGNRQVVTIIRSKRLGGFCVDNYHAMHALANNYAGYARANPNGITWTKDGTVVPAGF